MWESEIRELYQARQGIMWVLIKILAVSDGLSLKITIPPKKKKSFIMDYNDQ